MSCSEVTSRFRDIGIDFANSKHVNGLAFDRDIQGGKDVASCEIYKALYIEDWKIDSSDRLVDRQIIGIRRRLISETAL